MNFTLITVDGRSGSGKTTFSTCLENYFKTLEIKVVRINLDDFYRGWKGLRSGIKHYQKTVLDPLSKKERFLKYVPYNWQTEQLDNEVTIDLNNVDVVLIEGVGSSISSLYEGLLNDFTIISFWLEAPQNYRKDKALTRDGDLFRPYWDLWKSQEDHYFSSHHYQKILRQDNAAHITINSDKFDDHNKFATLSHDFLVLMRPVLNLSPRLKSQAKTTIPQEPYCVKASVFNLSNYNISDVAEHIFKTFYADHQKDKTNDSIFWIDQWPSIENQKQNKNAQKISLIADSTDESSLTFSHWNGQNILSSKHWKIEVKGDFFSTLKNIYEPYSLSKCEKSVTDFPYAWLCHLGYELKQETGAETTFLSPTPNAFFLFPGKMIMFDHTKQQIFALYLERKNEPQSSQKRKKNKKWLEKITHVLEDDTTVLPSYAEPSKLSKLNFTVSDSQTKYTKKIENSQREIYEGNSYEICLTTELSASIENAISDSDIIKFYLKQKAKNVDSYSSFIRYPNLFYSAMQQKKIFHKKEKTYTKEDKNVYILSASPERFLFYHATKNELKTEPIKGTRPRGSTKAEDIKLYKDLKTNRKDRVENIMIVDLARNDLWKVCQPDSVHVESTYDVRQYSSVWQMVSVITGRLDKNKHPLEAIMSCFPPASMTGVPKISTMGILDKLEQRPRGVYSGVLGYLFLSPDTKGNYTPADFDLSVVIRTPVIYPDLYDEKKRKITYGVGGAIIYDSTTEGEYQEIRTKAEGFLKNIQSSFP